MMKSLSLFIGLASALAAQTIREALLDPKQAVDLPVSREVTTVMFPGPITAVAGADMLIEGGKQSVEVEEGVAVPCLPCARLELHPRPQSPARRCREIDRDLPWLGLRAQPSHGRGRFNRERDFPACGAGGGGPR